MFTKSFFAKWTFLFFSLSLLISCGGGTSTSTTSSSGNDTTVATPAFSPAGGTYSSTQSVTITTSTSDATIRYTIDGSTPTPSSTTYAGPISVSATTTINACAWKTGLTPSSIATAAYTITAPPNTVAAPVFSPATGAYSSAQSVTITTATSDATIHYTIDGSTPIESSATYTSVITVSATTTIKAGAWKTGMNPSDISTATYTITMAKTPISWKRLITVQEWPVVLGGIGGAGPLGGKNWTPDAVKDRIGHLLDELQYMQVDAMAVTIRNDYIEAARDPDGYYPHYSSGTKIQIDVRAKHDYGNGSDMLGYLIDEAHARNIKVIYWYDTIAVNTASIYTWGSEKNECGNLPCSERVSIRLEVDDPAVKAYNYGIVKYVLENYNVDGVDLHEPFYINPSYSPSLLKRVENKYGGYVITSAIYAEVADTVNCSRFSTTPLDLSKCPNLGRLYDVEGDAWEELFAGYRQVFSTSHKKNPNALLGAGGHHKYRVVHGINIADVMTTGNLDYYSSEDLDTSNIASWKSGMEGAKNLFGDNISWSMGLLANSDGNTPPHITNGNLGVEIALSCEYGSAYEHLYPFSRRNIPFTGSTETMYSWTHANPPSSFCGE